MMTITTLHLEKDLKYEQQGQYLTLPFDVPVDTAEIRIRYAYPGQNTTVEEVAHGSFTAERAVSVIDLGLIGPDGAQVGVSGSDKDRLFLRENRATTGYNPRTLTPGRWEILIGAYKIPPDGITVRYEIDLVSKDPVLLMGDIHTHTVGSDGVFTLHELALHARRQGLDFLAITDHNQMVSQAYLNTVADMTLIPGVEWTHYQGHANFLGVDKPYDEPFFTNTEEDMRSRFETARQRNALIVINHPFDEGSGFKFDLTNLPFDAIEVWNGPMRESNLRAIGWWQAMLADGQKIPAVGGSDYHRDGLFQIIGGPCMGVYAQSDSPSDILAALRAGRSFITFAPRGPRVQLRVGAAEMGDSLTFESGLVLTVAAQGLIQGDIVRLITSDDVFDLASIPEAGSAALSYPITKKGFVRVEIHRMFIPGLPHLPAMLSNPIYVD